MYVLNMYYKSYTRPVVQNIKIMLSRTHKSARTTITLYS